MTARERSVIGKITRSGLDTRKSRPPASTIVASDLAMPSKFYGNAGRRTPVAARHLLHLAVLQGPLQSERAPVLPSDLLERRHQPLAAVGRGVGHGQGGTSPA